jgi:hypothetical protein
LNAYSIAATTPLSFGLSPTTRDSTPPQKRKARIYGEIVGYGESLDSHHPTHPDPDGKGIARAMTQAH